MDPLWAALVVYAVGVIVGTAYGRHRGSAMFGFLFSFAFGPLGVALVFVVLADQPVAR